MAVVNYILNGKRRNRAHYMPRVNHLAMLSDNDIVRRYRLNADAIRWMVEVTSNDLMRHTHRSCSVEPTIQVLLSLRILATDSFQSVIGDSIGVSKSTVSRCFDSTRYLASNDGDISINFPVTANDLLRAKQGFYAVAGFPNVIGAVDGTLVPIKTPSVDEHLFVGRKGFHALNVQVICNHDLM